MRSPGRHNSVLFGRFHGNPNPMAIHCDKCGIEALESQEFAEQRPIFGSPKRYCPVCHRKLVQRILFICYGAALFFAVFGVARANWREKPLLDQTGVWLVFFLILQVAIVLPHELGHAIVARIFRYKKIRILVGSGRLLITTKLKARYLFN